MAWDQNAERLAKEVNSSRESVVNSQKHAKTEANAIKQYWKGEGGESFSDSYKKIDNDVNQLTNKMKSLDQDLHYLAREIRAAEDERRREAERQERERERERQRAKR